MKAMLDIGGKESIMMTTNYDSSTVLHSACLHGASYNIIKMLIDVGGKDLVMAKDKGGETTLHHLCRYIVKHTKAAEIIKLILQVGDANLLLSTKNCVGRTPLKLATDKGASNIIKKLLTLQSTTNSTRRSNNPSTNILPADNSTPSHNQIKIKIPHKALLPTIICSLLFADLVLIKIIKAN
jgi:ankyrin repeat protein